MISFILLRLFQIHWINNLQWSYNAEKRKLNEIDDISMKTKICKMFYELSKTLYVLTNIDSNESDL